MFEVNLNIRTSCECLLCLSILICDMYIIANGVVTLGDKVKVTDTKVKVIVSNHNRHLKMHPRVSMLIAFHSSICVSVRPCVRPSSDLKDC